MVRPALESLKMSVPFSIVSAPSDSGLGELGLAAAGLASATDGANSQLGLPSALISSTILGSTRITSLSSRLPISSANSAGRTMIDFTSTMLGFLDPGALKNFTPETLALGHGSSDALTLPSITRSRPVAFFASDTIIGLKRSRSMKSGTTRSATTIRPTTPPAPISSFLRVEGLIFSPYWTRPTLAHPLAHRPAARHREMEDHLMADVINLRRARKEKARRDRNNEAETNRLRFGRTKGQKAVDAAEKERRDSVEAKRLEPKDD